MAPITVDELLAYINSSPLEACIAAAHVLKEQGEDVAPEVMGLLGACMLSRYKNHQLFAEADRALMFVLACVGRAMRAKVPNLEKRTKLKPELLIRTVVRRMYVNHITLYSHRM